MWSEMRQFLKQGVFCYALGRLMRAEVQRSESTATPLCTLATDPYAPYQTEALTTTMPHCLGVGTWVLI